MPNYSQEKDWLSLKQEIKDRIDEINRQVTPETDEPPKWWSEMMAFRFCLADIKACKFER